MRFFEWLKKLFSRKNKHLMLNAGISEQNVESKIIPTPISVKEEIKESEIGEEKIQQIDAIIEKEPIVEQIQELSEEEEMQKRLAAPYFSYKFTVLDGVTNRQYQGVDLTTGEILRLENTNKIAEEPNGTCIYSGFVEHAKNEKDIQLFEEEGKQGYPVIFESAVKLEDIASNKKPEEINAVLNLLSKSKEVNLMKDQLIYICGIRQDCQVYRQDCSSEQVAEKITKEMIQYRWKDININI